MSENYMAMLQNGAEVSARIYEQINDQMSKNLAVQKEAGNQQVALALKGLEFGEDQRMNDFRIREAQFINGLRAEQHDLAVREFGMKEKEFALRQSLIPKETEAANLRLEAARLRLENEKDARKDTLFNDAVSIFDKQMEYTLLETESTEMAKEYLGYKADWKTRIANGEKLDSQKYKEGMEQIINKWSTPDPFTMQTKGWSAEKQHLFSSVSQSLGVAFERKNPIIEKNANALAGAFLSISDAQVGEFMGKYGQMYDQEYMGLLGSARDRYKSNLENIDSYRRAAVKAAQDLEALRASGLSDASQLAKMEESINENIDVIRNLEKENNSLMTDAFSGKLKPMPSKSDDIKEEAGIDPRNYAKPSESSKLDSGLTPSSSEQEQKIYDKMKEIENIFSDIPKDQPNPLKGGGLDLKWFQDNITKEFNYEALTNIRTRIEANIDAMQSSGKEVDEIVNRSRAEKAFDKINGYEGIPISKELYSLITGSKVLVDIDSDQPKIYFGKMPNIPTASSVFLGKRKIVIESFDDINNFVSGFKTKGLKEEAKKELFAGLFTAATKQAIQKQ